MRYYWLDSLPKGQYGWRGFKLGKLNTAKSVLFRARAVKGHEEKPESEAGEKERQHSSRHGCCCFLPRSMKEWFLLSSQSVEEHQTVDRFVRYEQQIMNAQDKILFIYRWRSRPQWAWTNFNHTIHLTLSRHHGDAKFAFLSDCVANASECYHYLKMLKYIGKWTKPHFNWISQWRIDHLFFIWMNAQ